jgi:hypothetical protein
MLECDDRQLSVGDEIARRVFVEQVPVPTGSKEE